MDKYIQLIMYKKSEKRRSNIHTRFLSGHRSAMSVLLLPIIRFPQIAIPSFRHTPDHFAYPMIVYLVHIVQSIQVCNHLTELAFLLKNKTIISP